MNDYLDFLSKVKKSKIHSSEIANVFSQSKEEVKSHLLELKKQELINFDFPSGWVYLPKSQWKSQNEEIIDLGGKILTIGLIMMFFITIIGILLSFAGIYIILKAKLDLKDEDGNDIDIVGAGAIMNALTF